MEIPSMAAYRMATPILLLALFTPTHASAQSSATQPPGRTEILFLGTSGGPPLHLDRSEPSTLLIVDGRQYLIDCGIGTMRRMLHAGIQSEQINTIFFTHLHSDHDLGLADIMANDFFRLDLAGSSHAIDIYGPPQTKDLVDAAFRYITVSIRPFAAENPSSYRMVNGDFASPFVAHEIEHDGVVFQDDKIRVIAAENTHYALMPAPDRAKLKSYSYRIETPHGVVVFTGDTGPDSEAVIRLAKGADVLLAEASSRDPADLDRFVKLMATRNHWSADRAKTFRAHFQFEHLDAPSIGQLASKAQVKSVLLYHYDPADEADKAAYVSGVKSSFSGQVFAPADLDRYCLGPSGPKSNPGNVLAPCEGSAKQSGADAPQASQKRSTTMTQPGRIIGIGGIFFKSANPPQMKEWYAKHLGLADSGHGVMLPWREKDNPDSEQMTIWSVFPAATKYFEPSSAPFMLNYIVDDLDALLARLAKDGVRIDPKRQDESYGRFAWIYDPDGNKIELWQPLNSSK